MKSRLPAKAVFELQRSRRPLQIRTEQLTQNASSRDEVASVVWENKPRCPGLFIRCKRRIETLKNLGCKTEGGAPDVNLVLR